MFNDLLVIICFGAALFVLYRVIVAAAACNVRDWHGHVLRLLGRIAFYAMGGAGAVAVAVGAPIGGPLLLLAVTSLLLADRRVR